MPSRPMVHSRALADLVKSDYSSAEIAAIEKLLRARGALDFNALPTGLFPASPVDRDSEYTGYEAVWVRDNVHVANALAVCGATTEASRCVESLERWFRSQRRRLDATIERGAAPADPMERPHIRFNGKTLQEIPEQWNHGQNDAIGYLLWLYSRFFRQGLVGGDPEALQTIGRLALYLDAIAYWRDEDSGHWEEDPKIEASSIGAALAGLKAFRELLRQHGSFTVAVAADRRRLAAADLDRAIEEGQAALFDILPAECKQEEPEKRRPHDAALLFLIHPLGVVEGPAKNSPDAGRVARQIVESVQSHLVGPHGVRRYLGDTFWCADYHHLPEEIRTAPVGQRDAWFRAHNRPSQGVDGQAQWCLFDPLLSAIFGIWHRKTGDPRWRRLQVDHLNRALGQVVSVPPDGDGLRCPELFYSRDGTWVPNDVVPLLWTQANLILALHQTRGQDRPSAETPQHRSISGGPI